MTRRCSTCGINYPVSNLVCRVCEGQTSLISNDDPDPDWEMAQLIRATDLDLAGTGVADPDVLRWRLRQLEQAGFPPSTAWSLARNRDVNLHEALDLVAECEPMLAFSILA